MRVTVTDDNDEIVYAYSTDPNDQQLNPGKDEKPEIIEALEDALNALQLGA
jgi:hypothetical protein